MNELQQISLFPQRNIGDLMADIEILKKEIQELYCQDELPLVIGWSGGKDSSAVLQLVWYAIAELPIEKRHKKNSCSNK